MDIDADETVGDLNMNINRSCDADELDINRVDCLAQIGKTRFVFKGTVIDDMPAKLLSDLDGYTTEMVETFSL